MISTPTPRLTLTVDVTDLAEAARSQFVEMVGRLLEDFQKSASTVHGWTKETLTQALRDLEKGGGKVQAAVIQRAIADDGSIARETVYDIGGYDKDSRSLTGFTKPIKRITAAMKEAGEIPEDAAELLRPVYEGGVSAERFVVPEGLQILLR